MIIETKFKKILKQTIKGCGLIMIKSWSKILNMTKRLNPLVILFFEDLGNLKLKIWII